MGKLVIYTGPMKSGKTTKLIEKYNQVIQHSDSVVLLKPFIDNRFSNNSVVNRDRNYEIPAINIENLNDLMSIGLMYENIFIDEFQFLSGNISIINKLLDSGCNIYISGLNLTAERKPFGLMGDLLCLADTVHILRGNCDYCGKINKGVYTLYDGQKNQDILVGENNYKCVCSKCYSVYSNH